MINLAKRNIKNNTSIDLSRTPDEDHHSSVFQIDDRQVFKIEDGKQILVVMCTTLILFCQELTNKT